ncbi:MAG: membrane protein insertion efficiency factor YidD [Patescibacteria group bacterium]
MLKLGKIIKKSVLKGIFVYQKTLSPDHGPLSHLHPYGYCRFSPTCSDYAYQSIEKYGIFRGAFKGFVRILKCNPFSKGGIDPVR